MLKVIKERMHDFPLNHGFKFQDSVSSGWHDLTMVAKLVLLLLKILTVFVLFITLVNLK